MKKLSFPSFEKKGRLAYSVLEHNSGVKLLKGFYLESSIYEDSFFIQYYNGLLRFYIQLHHPIFNCIILY